MKLIVFSFFSGASLALLMLAPALGAGFLRTPGVAGKGEEEVACIGPGSITGEVVDAATILTPRFSSYKCQSHYPVYIKVQLKDPAAGMRIGDTVTLKGHLVYLQNTYREAFGYVLRDAELIQRTPRS